MFQSELFLLQFHDISRSLSWIFHEDFTRGDVAVSKIHFLFKENCVPSNHRLSAYLLVEIFPLKKLSNDENFIQRLRSHVNHS